MTEQTQLYLTQLTALLKKYQLWQNEPIDPAELLITTRDVGTMLLSTVNSA